MDDFEAQLLAVEQALQNGPSDEERAELEALKENLLELLALTEESGAEAPTDNAPTPDECQDSEKAPTESPSELEYSAPLVPTKEMQMEFEKLVGDKCSAPHTHSWGATAYHNALICGLEDFTQDGATIAVRVRVLYTNPTHREMLPCQFFLDGSCRFDRERCRYSHGEVVALDDLRAYLEPNFERLQRNCAVLAKGDDRIWQRGHVMCVNFVEQVCRVRLDAREGRKLREKDFAFEDLLPMATAEGEDEQATTSSGSDSEEETAEVEDVVRDSLLHCHASQPLGDWEKHTRGIGSKLMAQMGYVYGQGLGSEGRGIVVPISAQILPQGRSLDHCMELREASNGDSDFFSVERKLQRTKQKQAAVNARAYEREALRQRDDVFGFLNDNILAHVGPPKAEVAKPNPQATLDKQTTKSLNVASVRLADEIRRKEREITKVQASLRRNGAATEVHKRLTAQLTAQQRELALLRGEESSLSKEQATRKTKDKLCVF